METYLVLRRNAWQDAHEAEKARARAAVEAERRSELVDWIRSYTFTECDATIGSVCVYEAGGPEAIRRHSSAAALPIDQIVRVEEVIVLRPEYGSAWT
jgi:hypothetical protein